MASEYDGEHARRLARREVERKRRRLRRRVAVLATIALATLGAVVAVWPSHTTRRAAATTTPPPVTAADHPVRTRAIRIERPTSPRLVSTRASRAAAVPILMYHVIAPAPAGAPYPGLYVTPHEFAAQIHALVHAGFHGVTLDQVRAAWLGTAGLPTRPIVLTFDNGYRSQYTAALPVLRRAGWVADENLQLTGLPPREGGLTRREVKALVGAGWELDTQGYDHADLTELDPAQLRFQVAVTRARIRQLYGVAVSWFCYPSGHYNPGVVDAVRSAGFVGATTVVAGWARPDDDWFTLPRLRVLAGTTPTELLAQIDDAGDQPPPTA
jgi:peptidoglycan/xylan/chitin deacetylase (PgdA/CDA1 family)